MSKILYLSYDGMTDNLGMSQVLPYLKGLTECGHEIILVSFEKKEAYTTKAQIVKEYIGYSSISWRPISYHKSPPVLSTLYDIALLNWVVKDIVTKDKIDIIHCRSYITSIIGLKFKKIANYNLSFIFDMRGLWVDERVDGGLWNLKNPLYKFVYAFFKRKEKSFLINSDCIISLTCKAKDEILSWHLPNVPEHKIKIIPCCADLDLFSLKFVNKDLQNHQYLTTGIVKEKDFVISYLGSLGTWYMLDEMLDFFSCAKEKIHNAKFLLITPDIHFDISEKLKERNIDKKDVVIISAGRSLVPSLLSMSSLSIYFIKPVYSKISSSPTKLAEIMGMGIPVITNKGIGDTEEIFSKHNVGIFINDFSKKSYIEAIEEFTKNRIDKEQIIKCAHDYFSLQKGILLYNNVYTEISNAKH